MILRKLTAAVSHYDRFVVFIELLVVVFRLYIGIYLEDARAARQIRK